MNVGYKFAYPTFRKKPPNRRKGMTTGGPMESATEMLELTLEMK